MISRIVRVSFFSIVLFWGLNFLLINNTLADEHVTPPPSSDEIKILAQKNIGSGSSSDVVILKNKLWIVAQQGQDLNIYTANIDLSNISLSKKINIGASGQFFPRITSYKEGAWVVYRDSKDSQVKLWNSANGAIEVLGQTDNNTTNPAAAGEGLVAWQKAGTGRTILLRSLDGKKGTEKESGEGRPTGISRIYSGAPILVEEDRESSPNGNVPSFAGPYGVVQAEEEDGGIILFDTAGSQLATIFEGQESLSPRITTDDKGSYVIITWGPGSTGVRLATFKGTPHKTEDPPGTTLPLPSRQPVSAQNEGLPTDLGQFVEALFNWSLALVGLIIFVRFFYAGFIWFTAQGSSGKIQQARDIMKNAIYGTAVLFSAYLILNTINPDLVRNTFDLPGFEGTKEQEAPPPADALTKHPDRSSLVAQVKADLKAKGVNMLGPCGSFAIVKETAYRLREESAGILKKPSGNNCQGYSVDFLVFSDGYGYDILVDAGNIENPNTEGKNTPVWQPKAKIEDLSRYTPVTSP